MSKAKKTEQELSSLLENLYTMQEDLGCKEKTTNEEKKAKAETATMGRHTKAEKKGTRFLELKSSIVEKLQVIANSMKELNESKGSVAANKNPKEMIALQNEVREQIREISEEWREMDEIYRKEAKKRRSKFSPEELEIQKTLVERLGQEIEKIKEMQMNGFGRGAGAGGGDATPLMDYKAIAMPDNDAALTEGQAQQLQVIEERDQDFDRQLEAIGEGLDVLQDIADQQGEQVRAQNAMLNNLETKMDAALEHQKNINENMKDILEQSSRPLDKLCVDIMCVVFAIGFVATFINMYKKYSDE